MQPLYIEPIARVFEKNASEVTLPEDANSWSNEIMQELYKQVPFIADFEPEVVMDRVDAERGYGFGHVEVKNKSELQANAAPAAQEAVGVQTVRIPVIIKDRKLYPFDVIVTADSKMLPLNEGRMRQALFRPQAFDVTSRTPGDMSMVGQLYPPYRQNYGGSGGGAAMSVGMGKEGSALEEFLEKDAKERSGTGKHVGEVAGGGLGGIAGHAAGRALTGSLKGKGWKEQLGGHVVRAGTTLAGMGAGGAAGHHIGKNVEYSVRHVDKQERALRKAYDEQNKEGSAVPNSTVEKPAMHSVKATQPKWKTGSVLAAILPTINPDDHSKFASALEDPAMQAAYVQARAFTGPALVCLSQYEPTHLNKTAEAINKLLKHDVVQVTKLGSGYRIKMACTRHWDPTSIEADRGGLVRALGEKIALAADATGSVTMAEGADVKEEVSPESMPEIVSSFGLYRVKDEKGQELIGYVFPNLLDTDGTSIPIVLFTNGSATALQESVAGEHVGKDSGLVFGPEKGHGMFVRQLPNGGVDAMVPMTIKGGYAEGGEHKMHVETYDGREMFVDTQPNIQHPTEVDGTCIVPEDFKWLPLGGEDVSLVDHPEEWGQAKEASRAYASVILRAGGEDSFSLSGLPLEKFASEEVNFLNLDDTLFLLAGLGTNLQYASEKIASSIATFSPVQIRIGRNIKTAAEGIRESQQAAILKMAHIPNLRRSLIKEAAFVPDPLAVDTVLSVGFINPENIMTFVSYLPQLDQSQGRLCELLVAARMGMTDVPTSPLEKCIKSIEEVIDGLKVLAFSKS
jgi:hypothetical protein